MSKNSLTGVEIDHETLNSEQEELTATDQQIFALRTVLSNPAYQQQAPRSELTTAQKIKAVLQDNDHIRRIFVRSLILLLAMIFASQLVYTIVIIPQENAGGPLPHTVAVEQVANDLPPTPVPPAN